MTKYEHAQMLLSSIPTEITSQCNLRDVSVSNKVYLEVRKGMPGFKQSIIIAHNRLSKHLEQADYECSQYVPSLWRNASLSISFTLVVDGFGVKYVGKYAAMHLIDTLRKNMLFLLIGLVAIISDSPRTRITKKDKLL